MADLNGDGQVDLLSGSWPGELYFFRGSGKGQFAAPVILKDAQQEEINVEGGVEVQPDGMILIRGRADWKSDPKTGEQYVEYRGKRYASSGTKRVGITGCAAHLHAADWDGDGDFDLLVGTIGGALYLIPNEGSAAAWRFGETCKLQAGGVEPRLDGDAAPCCVDWDRDGDLDLLSGCASGGVWLFENIGSARQPALSKGVELLPSGVLKYGPEAPEEIGRGGRSKLCATDWNGDGWPDLLVGDVFYQKNPALRHQSPDAKRRWEEGQAQLKALYGEAQKWSQKLFGPNALRGEDEIKQATAELQTAYARIEAARKDLPEEALNHGSVWLLLRKGTSR